MFDDHSFAPYSDLGAVLPQEEEMDACSNCRVNCRDVWCRLRTQPSAMQDCGNGYLDKDGIFHAYE